MTDSKKLFLTLEMSSHQVDAYALTGGLAGFCDLLEELRRDGSDAEGLDIKVEALNPGSFKICLNLLGRIAPIVGCIASDAGGILPLTQLITAAVEYLKLHEFLAGSQADSAVYTGGGQVIIHSGCRNVTVNKNTYNIYVSSPSAADACRTSMQAVRSDKSIRGLKIEDEEHEVLAQFDSSQLERLSSENGYMDDEMRVVIDAKAVLTLRSPSLDGTGKWKCLYHGNKINVEFRDHAFIEKVRSRELSFANQDQIPVQLEIESQRVPGSQTWKDKRFSVVSVDMQRLESLPHQLRLEKE